MYWQLFLESVSQQRHFKQKNRTNHKLQKYGEKRILRRTIRLFSKELDFIEE